MTHVRAWLRRSAWRPFTIALVLIAATFTWGSYLTDSQAHARCRDNRDNRAVIRQLVDVATGQDEAGRPHAEVDLSALTRTPQWQAADKYPEIQTLLLLLLSGGGSGDTTSRQDRLIEFADKVLTPIDCGT